MKWCKLAVKHRSEVFHVFEDLKGWPVSWAKLFQDFFSQTVEYSRMFTQHIKRECEGACRLLN